MKILIVSNSVWRNDNSFGNSFSNIFCGMKDIKIANIYCQYGVPDENSPASRFFQINEKMILRKLIDRKVKVGREVFRQDSYQNSVSVDKNIFAKFYKKHKGTLMFILRSFIWKTGKWKSPELISFLDNFNPDILFIPVYYSHYIHDINFFIQQRYHIPAVGYVSDDVYTLKQFSLSPLYWLDRLFMRRIIKRVFSLCTLIYTISDIQCQEYTKLFGNKFSILTKGVRLDENTSTMYKDSLPETPFKILYTGNLSAGRYRSLLMLVNAIKKCNIVQPRFILDIYTATQLPARIQKKFMVEGVSNLHSPVPNEEVKKLQNNADILVHVEGMNLSDRLTVHQSFSTKIVDYLAAKKCILAIGKKDCASIAYFETHDAGIIAQSEVEIESNLMNLSNNPATLREWEQKAWKCAVKYHNIFEIQKNLYNSLCQILLERGTDK